MTQCHKLGWFCTRPWVRWHFMKTSTNIVVHKCHHTRISISITCNILQIPSTSNRLFDWVLSIVRFRFPVTTVSQSKRAQLQTHFTGGRDPRVGHYPAICAFIYSIFTYTGWTTDSNSACFAKESKVEPVIRIDKFKPWLDYKNNPLSQQ